MPILSKFICKSIIVIITMVSLCFILSIIPNYIPGHIIKKNLDKSIDIIISDDSEQPICNLIFFKLDNFTDALMLNIANNVNSNTPLKSAMENKYFTDDNFDIISTTKNIINNDYDNATSVNYTRYWHGNQLFLRPLLLICDYNGIRIVNCICLSFLFIFLCFLLIKNEQRSIAISLCISIIAMNLWIVPLSMQFSTTFYISFLASIFLLLMLENKNNMKKNIFQFFIVVGGATSFFDLLTTPLITLGIPLIIYTSVINISIREKIYSVVSCSIAWIIGYSFVWISKWCFAHYIIGYDFYDAISSIMFRTSTEYNDFDMSLKGIFDFMINHAPIAFYIASILFILFIIFNLILYYKKKSAFIENSFLLLISSMPIIWCIVLRNHSIIHCSFVWRVFIISMVSYILFINNIYLSKNKNNKKYL